MIAATNRRLAIAVAVVTVLGLASVAFWGGSAAKAPPQLQNSVNVIVAAGVVEPASEEVQLANEIGGTLRAVMVREGDQVAKGQIVAALVDDEIQAELASTRFVLEQRSAELQKLRAGTRIQERREALAALSAAQARLDAAEATLSRLQPLIGAGFVTRAAIDNAVAARGEAKGLRNAAVQRLSLANAPPRAEDVQVGVAAARAAAANVSRATATAEKSTIRAPIAGTVLRVLARPGEVVSILRPTTIVIIGNLQPLHVRAEVDEADIGGVVPGQRAHVTVDAYPAQKFGGAVISVAKRMGNKQIALDDPSSRKDAMVLEVLLRLDDGVNLPIGLRCDVFIAPNRKSGT